MDDYLQECLKAGATQVVSLGAGLDSRAYRNDLMQGAIKFFEVYHPATQAHKKERAKKVLGKIPPNLTYVPVDFNLETLDKLLEYGFDKSMVTLFIWEGVTQLLKAEAVDRTLSWVQANALPVSSIIFDYQYLSSAMRVQTERNIMCAVLSRISGEKRTFGITKGEIVDFLTRKGFRQVVEVNAAQLKRLYCTSSNQGRKVTENYAMVRAEVGERDAPDNDHRSSWSVSL